ncbi:aspartyl protease family protein At5g10770-like [Prosopis cineraria]|uniref:aspartyl protease family protein At5g10770-like n=1 Tax=Prosopis cineraria TaxID=364024 RepID=UPI00241011A3|nr:aspartyl protease family protein At5g10770-like [Prosopis cineraria]
MASSSSNPFLFAFISVVCFFFFLIENEPFVSAITRKEASELLQQTQHHVHLTSFFPSSSCTSPPKGASRKGYLEVVHKHGPCSEPKQQTSSSSFIIPHREILMRDQARARSIHSKLYRRHNYNEVAKVDVSSNRRLDRVQLPAKSGVLLGTGNYFVTVGLGSPKRDLSLDFDTGSDLTWTQCEPCLGSCYSQKQPVFDPSHSSSYSDVSCSSSQCSQLLSATGFFPLCNTTTRACMYGLIYADESTSIGFFAKEKLTISPTDVFDDFLFGCGQNNTGLFGGTAGLLGLGRDPLSFVQQTAHKYHRIFSYCLPSTPSAVGYLNFGPSHRYSYGDVKYTPFSSIFKNSSFYGLDFVGISLGGVNIPISASSGTVIDSGSEVTWLPPAAYSSLRDEFQRQMWRYPKADPVEVLDTCYNLRGYEVVHLPKVSLTFGGGVNVTLDASGILYVVSKEQACLGFAANKVDGDEGDDVVIIGNTQQKTLEVVYDVDGERIGFRSHGCK